MVPKLRLCDSHGVGERSRIPEKADRKDRWREAKCECRNE